jgi:hypothetical protein
MYYLIASAMLLLIALIWFYLSPSNKDKSLFEFITEGEKGKRTISIGRRRRVHGVKSFGTFTPMTHRKKLEQLCSRVG